MKWLERILLLSGLMAGTVALLLVSAGLFILTLQSPVEIKALDAPAQAQEVFTAP